MQVSSMKFKSFGKLIAFCYQNHCDIELNGQLIATDGCLFISKSEIKDIFEDYTDEEVQEEDCYDFMTQTKRKKKKK
jgi:hypothetical protein